MKINKYHGFLCQGKDIRLGNYNKENYTLEQRDEIERAYREFLTSYKNCEDKFYLILKPGKTRFIKLIPIKRQVPKIIKVPGIGRFTVTRIDSPTGSKGNLREYALYRAHEYDDIIVAKIKPNATIPKRENGNAGFDVFACLNSDELVIKPGETVLVPTGISVIPPTGFYLHAAERSSTGKMGMKLSAGVIDGNYRGEIFVQLFNASGGTIVLTKEDSLHKQEIPTEKGLGKGQYYAVSNAIIQLIPRKFYPTIGMKEVTLDNFTTIVNKEEETAKSNGAYFRGDGALGSTNSTK